MTTNEEVEVRVGGDETACRKILDGLKLTADVSDIEGPFTRDGEEGVALRARAVPRQRAADPGE